MAFELKVWYEISHIKANEILKKLNDRAYTCLRMTADEYLESNKDNKLTGFTYFHKTSTSKNSINETLQFKVKGKWYNYIINKSVIRDKDYMQEQPNPARAVAVFSNMVKYEKYDLPMMNLGAEHYANEKYMGVPLKNCICYDRNKAYFATCINLKAPLELIGELYRAPKEGEMGFNGNGYPVYGPSTKCCRWIFKCGINESLNRWAYYMLDKLNNAQTKEEKKFIKDSINIAIGNLGNKKYLDKNNRPLRNTIVWTMNKFIKNLMDENTLFSNTDSIVSLVPRPDLKISDNIGDFKIEHQGDFIYLDAYHYQWNNDEVNGTNNSLQERWEKANNKQFELGKDDFTEFFNYKPIEFNIERNQYEECK